MNIARIAVEPGNIPGLTDKQYCVEIYCCGCKHKCERCHNKMLWDFEGGKNVKLSYIMNEVEKRRELSQFVIFLGGEFGEYPAELAILSSYFHKLGMKNILYTGYNLEDFNSSILTNIDYILCGKYDEKDPAKLTKIRRLLNGKLI